MRLAREISPRGVLRGLFLSAFFALAQPSAVASPPEFAAGAVRVELGGRLERGESLSVVAAGTRWEVDVTATAQLAAAAGGLEGSPVAIVGSFAERSQGSRLMPVVRAVEIRRVAQAPAVARVRLHGTLKVGVMAIGAETTGVTVHAGGRDWELQLQPRHVEAVEEWNGRSVDVDGRLELRAGVEVRTRRIVHARRIAPRPAQP